MRVSTHTRAARPGITLTEILISLMIMGVGMVSLATLFPLGLLRMRDANRMTRSALLAESAMNDISSRNLLLKLSFLNPYYNPYTVAGGTYYDQWLYDTPSPAMAAVSYNNSSGAVQPNGVSYSNLGTGLPVAYDPLLLSSGNLPPGLAEAPRFGMGLGSVRPDSSGGGTTPSACGLQRLTNLAPYPLVPSTTITGSVSDIFVSPEDVVFQSKVASTGSFVGDTISTVVPDMSFTGGNGITSDWRYSWIFTGHQSDNDGNSFEGQIVIFENRPLTLEPVTSSNSPFASMNAMPSQYVVSGEVVVEAIFGYSANVNSAGYGQGADKTILLRWPATMSDPDVKVGSWIADVTYERNPTVAYGANGISGRFGGTQYPGQRCLWYQIVKRTDPAFESIGVGLQNALSSGQNYRAMTVWVSSSLQAKTQNISGGSASGWVANAALVCPNVVNVIPRTIYTR